MATTWGMVVEANLRSSGFDQVFGIKRNGGFANLVLGQHSLAEVAQPTATPGLFAIGCGTTTLAPSTLFDSPGLTQALEDLRNQFDFVIFDTPPVNVYGDSPILCPRLDAAVIVIEADRTRMPEVERRRIEQHLQMCAECRALLSDWGGTRCGAP